MKDSYNGQSKNRRNVLRTLGTVGVGFAGVGSFSGVAAAGEVGTEGGEFDSGGDAGGSGGTNYIGIDHERVITDEAIDDALAVITIGCGLYTVGYLTGVIPGPHQILIAGCLTVSTYTAAKELFFEEHGEENVTVFEVTESGGDLNAGDHVMVPASWSW